MDTYKCTFYFMGAFIVLEVQHDTKSENTLSEVCEALARKLGMDFMYQEEV